jgi:DNA modification methylase
MLGSDDMLGKYKLNEIYNEDSYEAIKKIPNKSVDCIYTDIPYISTFSGGGTLKHKLGKYIKDEVDSFSKGIDYEILKEFVRIMKNINCFIWCSKSQLLDIMNFFNKYNVDMNLLTWTKTNPIPFGSSIWLSDIEYCLHFYKNAGFNIGWENKRKNYSSPINNNDKKLYDHPTIKPIECIKRHLLNLTRENDIVADFFLGSGTTAVACKELGRQYIGFEIDNEYYEIAKKRLNGINASGQTSIFTNFEQLGSDINEYTNK